MANLGNTIINGALRVNGKINSSDVISAPSFTGALTGNAATATKLKTARTINGVSFDGSANITVADSTKLPLTGGTLSGAVNFANGTLNKIGDDVSIGDVNQAGKLGIKGLNGATGIYFQPHSGSTAQSLSIDGAGAMTISGKIKSTFEGNLTGTATKATQDADGNVISSTYLKLSGGTMTGTIKGVDSVGEKTFFDIGSVDRNTTILRIHDKVDDTANAKGAFGYTLKYLGSGSGVENRLVLYADNLEAANQVAAISMTNNGKITFGEEVTAATFKGSLNGNAATATKLQTARTIALGGIITGSTTFDGSGNKTITTTIDGFSTVQTITKSMKLTTAWQDTGILTGHLSAGSGSYLVQVTINNGSASGYYNEYWTGVMSVCSANTNSVDSSEVVLHNNGHSTNGNTIFLRVIKQSGSSASSKIQISDTHAWASATDITFKFRRLI